jgi:glycosyltransferase involved in cell wall biosynthesis
MNILIISSALPYPLIDGGRKGVFFPIKGLAERGHRVHLACLAGQPDPDAVRVLSQYCSLDVVVAPHTPTPGGAFRSLFSATPYDLSRYHRVELMEKLRRKVSGGGFDLVQAEGAHETWYAVTLKKEYGIPTVIRIHSLQHMNILRLAASFGNPAANLFLKFDGVKARRYEARECQKVDANLTVSDTDARILQGLNPSIRCVTVPAGVNLEDFVPSGVPPDPGTVLWMGSLSWAPNRDSFWWFYRSIVPHLVKLLPGVRIKIVGSGAARDILAVRHPNVEIVGFVSDVRHALQSAQVCVVPLQAGSGIRIKMLEMFAMNKAVVSTSVGCEGLGVKDGTHLLVGDTPEEFARHVVTLLANPELCATLGGNGRAHVLRSYGWDSIVGQYEAAYRYAIELAGDRRGDR